MVTKFLVRHFRATSRLAKTHYDTLGITQAASQSEVKVAYYRKSMELHPDREHGDRDHFEAVVSAYKVLSDPESRKMYDRNELMVKKCSHQIRTIIPRDGRQLHPSSKSPMYNYDAWLRFHYGEELLKNRMSKRRDHAEWRANLKDTKEQENVVMGFMLLLMAICLIGLTTSNANLSKSSDVKPRKADPAKRPDPDK